MLSSSFVSFNNADPNISVHPILPPIPSTSPRDSIECTLYGIAALHSHKCYTPDQASSLEVPPPRLCENASLALLLEPNVNAATFHLSPAPVSACLIESSSRCAFSCTGRHRIQHRWTTQRNVHSTQTQRSHECKQRCNSNYNQERTHRVQSRCITLTLTNPLRMTRGGRHH